MFLQLFFFEKLHFVFCVPRDSIDAKKQGPTQMRQTSDLRPYFALESCKVG